MRLPHHQRQKIEKSKLTRPLFGWDCQVVANKIRFVIKIIGLDSSQEMLAQAKTKLIGSPEVTFVLGDANHPLPFSDARFDVVVSANALHYVIQPEKLLGEIKRILKPGGQLVIEDFTVHGQVFWPVFELLIRVFDPQLYKTYTLIELSQFVKAAGLTTRNCGSFKIDWLWQGMFVRATQLSK